MGRVDNLPSELKKVALDELVDERIKMQEIVKQEIDVSEENVQDALAHLEQQNGMPVGGFQKMLEEQGIPYQTLVNQTKANLGWLQVIQKSGRRIQVLPADIKARQKIIRQELMREAVTFAEIIVKTEEEALTILHQLQSGSDFGTMVALHSIADSRVNGGRVIEVSPNYYGDEVAEIFNEMQAGQLSRPIKVRTDMRLS
jgi:peptidyl-prolyl cis-trans isomerase SurA